MDSALPVTFQQESIAELWPELGPLADEHHREVWQHPGFEVGMNRALYNGMDAQGILRVYTVRCHRWRLVGYASFFLMPSLHHVDLPQASQDAIYLQPKHRVGGTGPRFLAWCDEQLRAAGAKLVYHHAKVEHDFGRVLQLLGYRHTENVYCRRLVG